MIKRLWNKFYRQLGIWYYEGLTGDLYTYTYRPKILKQMKKDLNNLRKTMGNLMLVVVVASIHYSAFGNYLVNQNGKRVVIQGHPQMVCYQGQKDIHGTFDKAKGAIIWLRVDPAFFLEGDDIVKIEKPVCDILGDK